jgi:hypothetical protein
MMDENVMPEKRKKPSTGSGSVQKDDSTTA